VYPPNAALEQLVGNHVTFKFGQYLSLTQQR